MTFRNRAGLAAMLGVSLLALLTFLPDSPGVAASDLPERLSDAEFWRLASSFSEPGGTFHSDNFVSNEGQYQTVIPELNRRARQRGLYVGVGPEQNFTYMAALRPRIAFIVDIRRGNLHEHLLYKALFEMSSSRAEFLGHLFSREVPHGLPANAPVEQLFAAFEPIPPSVDRYRKNLDTVTSRLTETHGFALTDDDVAGIDYVYRTAFFADGPHLNYRLTGQQGGGLRGGVPTYAQLMALDDGTGAKRSFLSDEARFGVVRDMQLRNLVIPVVGDFGGPKALQAIGKYARDNGATVTTFYLSNVEQYLRQDRKMAAFCANVASMPLDESSTYIRAVRSGGLARSGRAFTMFMSALGPMREDPRACATR